MSKYRDLNHYIEALEQMDDSVKSFSKTVLLQTLKAMDRPHQIKGKPSKLKKGDVYLQHVGTKKRPVVIIHVEEEIVYGFPLSTTEDCLNMCPSLSRFFGEGFINKGLVTAPTEYAIENFAGIYDNPKRIHSAVKMFKEQLNSIN